MKVRELIGKLQECNEDDLVVMSSDSEGCAFSELTEITKDKLVPEKMGPITLYVHEELFESRRRFGEADNKNPNEAKTIILWPSY